MSKIEFIILISASAFSWSCFDYARKKMTAVLSVPITFWILMLGQIPLFLSFAGLFTNSFSVEREYYLWGALGIFINFFANALFIFSVSMSSFIKAIPMLSFAPVFSAIFSWIFLSEKLLFMQVLGICMVVWGAFLLNGFPSMSGDKKGPLLMQLAAVFWGLMSVLDKHCLKFSTVAFHSFFQTSGLMVLGTLWCVQAKQFHELKRYPKFLKSFLIAIVASVCALGLQLYTVQFVPVAIMESTKRGFNLFWTIIFGYFFFKETIGWKKVGSLISMILGLYLLLR